MSKKRKTSETSEVVFEYTGMEEKDDVPKQVEKEDGMRETAMR